MAQRNAAPHRVRDKLSVRSNECICVRLLRDRSKILHHGRLTSVVRTQITGKNNRRVLEVVTTHGYRAG